MGIPPALSSEWFVPLVPDGDSITGTDLLLVLPEGRGPGDDSTGQTRPTVPVSETGQPGAQAQVVLPSRHDQTTT